MSGSNFNHTVITSDGAALIRRSKEENKKIVFVKAVSSQNFESLRGDLVHKNKDWFESIEGSVIAVQAVDGVFKLAVSFSQAPSKVTLKSIGILAKLTGETDAQAVVFSAASDDNSQLIVDTSSAVVAFVEDLPAAINASNTDSYGTIPQGGGGGGGGDISGCIASGVYDSTNHNILLKNNVGTVLSTIDCSAFIVDGMVEDVEIENGYLVISFNTDAGKQDISIPLTDIFNPANYYTKTECDNTFLSSADLDDYALKSEIPTATSDLTNDSGFITSSDLSDYALKSEIPTDTSDLTNGAGFITNADLSTYALKSEIPTATSDLTNDSGFITSADLSTYALKTEIPTDNSELTNGAGYITNADLSGYAQTADLGGAAYKGVDTSIGGSPTNDNLPTSLAVTNWASQTLAGYVASGEYVSADQKIYLKNSAGTVLSQIDARAFIKDGMVDTVAISNGYLVITFNTDSGKQPISIALSDIFDPSNYYTKAQVDSGFMTTSTDQLTLTGGKKWPYHWGDTDTALELRGGETPWVRLSNTEETNTTRTDNLIDVFGGPNSQITVERSIADITDPDQPTQYYTASLKPDILDVRSTFPDDSYIHTEITGGSIVLEDTNGLEPFQASIDSDGFYAGDPGSANEVILKRAIGGLNVNATIGGVQRQISLTISNGLSLDGKVLANDSVGFKHQDQSTGAYASLDATDGLKILGATGTTIRQIDKMGLLMGSLRVYWSDVPVQFKENNNAYEVVTYGSQATTSRIKKTYITQVYVSEENNTLKCKTQFDGDSSWSASTVMDELTPKDIVRNRLKLIFDSSSKLVAIRLVGSISLSTLCTFKLLVPQSGSYSMIHGMLYVEPGTVNTADYTLSTPVELEAGDLLICEAEFMPCSFTSPDPAP